MDTQREDDSVHYPPPAEIEAAFSALPAEARGALWLILVERVRIDEVAESLGATESDTVLLIERGAATMIGRLQRHGWGSIRAAELAKHLLALPGPDPPAGLEERVITRFDRYFT